MQRTHSPVTPLFHPSWKLKVRVLLGLFLVSFTPHFGHAQEVAILVSGDFSPYQQAIGGISSQLSPSRESTIYQMKGDTLEGREMAKRIRASGPAVVLAVGLKAALVAKIEIVDTPVVFCLVLNPSTYGLPASNMVGIRLRVPGVHQLRAIQSLVPSLKTVGLVFDPEKSGEFVSQARKDAQALGLSLLAKEVSTSADLPVTLRSVLPAIDVLWLIRDSTVISQESIPYILETALRHDRPVFGFSAGLAQHGALAAVSVDYADLGRQAGALALTILREGQLPDTSPLLLAPRETHLALNLGTAQYLGISPKPEMVQLAASVFGGSGALARQGSFEASDSPREGLSEPFLVQ